MAANITEMHVEDLVAGTKITDDVVDLGARIREHFRDRALAKIQPMVGALMDAYELLQAVYRAQHPVHALIAFRWHAGIVRVTGHADFVFIRHRNHSVEE